MNVPFYLDAIWKSMSNIPWLREQRKNVVRASKYFLGLILIISVIDAVIFSRTFVEDINKFAQKAVEVAPNFALERKDGELKASGITEPFVFETVADGQPFMFFIDTSTTSAALPVASLLQSKEKNTFLIAVTSDMVRLVEGETGNEQIITAAELPENGIIPYGKTLQRIQEFAESKRALAIVITITTLLLFILYTIGELLYLAFIVLLIRGVVYIKKATWTYGELFTVGLFLMTLPLLIDEISSLFNWNFSFFSNLALIGLFSLVISHKEEKKEQTTL